MNNNESGNINQEDIMTHNRTNQMNNNESGSINQEDIMTKLNNMKKRLHNLKKNSNNISIS